MPRKTLSSIILIVFLFSQCVNKWGLPRPKQFSCIEGTVPIHSSSHLRLETPDEAPATGTEFANALGAPEGANAAPAAGSQARAGGEAVAKMTGEVGEPVAALTVEASPPPVKSAVVSETPETEGAQAASKRVLMITDNVVNSNHYGNMIIELLDYSEGAIEEVTWVVLSEGLAEQEEKENIQQAINEYKPDEILLYISDTTRLERILPMFNGMSVQNFSGMKMDDLRHAVERWMSA